MISLRKYFKSKMALRRPADPLTFLRIALNAVIAASLLALSVFLYTDFYKTMIQAQTVVVLKQEVSLQDINLATFEIVDGLHNYKIKRKPAATGADPFKTDPEVKIANEPSSAPENMAADAPAADTADPQGILPTF